MTNATIKQEHKDEGYKFTPSNHAMPSRDTINAAFNVSEFPPKLTPYASKSDPVHRCDYSLFADVAPKLLIIL